MAKNMYILRTMEGLQLDNEYIEVENGLDVADMRILLDVTNTMVRGINKEEFYQIMNIYSKATERLLNKQFVIHIYYE